VFDRGAKVTARLTDQPYGIRDFSVIGPCNLTIVFGQDID
jgi:hypothetical protein